MHNRQLDAFVRVAKMGSFSKAAESLFVTPSAMIQQINNLEKDLGAPLFLRSRKGVQLTPAGEYLLKESQKLIEKSREIRAQIQEIQKVQQTRIRVGTNILHKLRLFGPLWQAFKLENPDAEVEFVDTTQHSWTEFRTDLVECVLDGEPWQHGLALLEVSRIPIVVAAPPKSREAQRGTITMEELRGKTMVTIRRGMCAELDQLANGLHALGIKLMEVDEYNLSVFSMCEVEGYYLQIPECWKDLCGGMKPLPCDWDYALPYGFFYKPEPTGALKAFIEFVKAHTETGEG